jgi:hypothetical protein
MPCLSAWSEGASLIHPPHICAPPQHLVVGRSNKEGNRRGILACRDRGCAAFWICTSEKNPSTR